VFDIKMTINGRPMTEANIKSELDKAVFGQICEHIQQQLKDVPTELNGEKLTVEFVGTDLNNLSVHLSGPDELLKQAKKALGAE